MKQQLLLAAAVALISSSAGTVYADKRLTTGSSGIGGSVQCVAVNVSETKTVMLTIKVRNASGVALAAFPFTLGPLQRGDVGVDESSIWCEFVLTEGSPKDVRANSIMTSASGALNMEVAREK